MKKWICLLLFLSCTEGKKYHNHPFLSQSPWPIVHRNPAQHAGTEFRGPEGELDAEVFDYRGPGWVLFDSKGNILFGGVNVLSGKHEFRRFNSNMELLSSLSLSYENLTSILGGIYSFLDHEDCIWTSTDVTIHRLCERGSRMEEDMRFNVWEIHPEGFSADETILSMIPLYSPSAWMEIAFLTIGIKYVRQGNFLRAEVPGAKLGILRVKDKNSVEVYHHTFEGEAIQNAAALDRDDNLYVVTNRKLYKIKFQKKSNTFEVKWSYSYEPGPPPEDIECEEGASTFGCLLLNYLKKVRFFDGSGTTPTLMGDNEEYVGFADGDRPMKVIVLRTHDGSPVEVNPPVPFSHDPLSQTENTLAYVHRKFVVENNNPHGTGVACYEIKGTYSHERVELRWVNEEVFAPNNVPLVSGSSNAAFVYELQEGERWFLTALDMDTGEIRWRKFIGEGMDFNSMYAPLDLNDRGEIYIGLFGKILRVRGKK